MRGVREDESVRLAVDEACERWERAIDAWETITWAIVRDPEVGTSLNEDGTVRAFVFDGARSISMPSVEVIYRFDRQYVTIADARFYDAPHRYAGRA